MDFIYETLEGGEELENFIIETRLPHLQDPQAMLALWEDAIESWNTKNHLELQRRKHLLYEWLTWMREANVLVPPFTDLPVKFERDSAPPVNIEAHTTESIVKAIENKLTDQARKGILLAGRLEGGVVDGVEEHYDEVDRLIEATADLEAEIYGAEDGIGSSVISSSSTLRPEEQYKVEAPGSSYIIHGVDNGKGFDRLKAGARGDIEPYYETKEEYVQPETTINQILADYDDGDSDDQLAEITERWTFITEEKDETCEGVTVKRQMAERMETFTEDLLPLPTYNNDFKLN